MSNGDDDDKKTGQDLTGDRQGRRRNAIRPTVIEGEAREIAGTASEAAETTPGTPPVEAAGEADADTPETETPETETSVEETSPESEDGRSGEDAASDLEPEEAAAGETTAGETEGETAEETAPARAEPVHLPTARRASVIAAGIVGAVLALGTYLALDYARILPRGGATNAELTTMIQDMDRRIADVETAVARAAKRDNSKAITGRVNSLERSVKELGAEPGNSLVKRMADAEAKLESMSQTVAEAPAAKDLDERLTYVEDKLAEAGTGAAALGAEAESRLAGIEKRLGAVEARPAVVAADGQPIDDAAATALSQRLAALDAQMKQTTETVAALSKDASAANADRMKEIDATLAAMRTELDRLGGTVDGITGDVDAKLAEIEKTVEESGGGEARRMARTTAGALAVGALERAAGSGRPYAAELDVLRPLVDDKTDLAVLDAHAATGVADLAALQAEFPAAANAVLTAGTPGETGIVGSLVESARSLVRVRPTGRVEGTGRGAIVARIEAALKAGDLKAAESEWESLDDAAKVASQSWADKLKARVAVDGALAGLSAALTASLSGATAND